MTKIPNKPSFDRLLILLAVLLLVSLGGFFFYAAFVEASFFILIALALVFVSVFFILLYRKYAGQATNLELKQQDISEKINLMDDEVRKDEKVIETLRRKIVNYSELKGLTERLSLSFALEDTSRVLVAEINRLFGQDDITTIFYLFHARTGELGLSSSQKGQMRVNIKAKKGDIFDEWVIKTLQPLLVEDAKSDFRFDIDKIVSDDARVIRSLISVPLMIGNKALGILRVDSFHPQLFETQDLRFLMTIGDLGAVAVENAQLYERLEEIAIRDSLTGLYLRRYLLGRLQEEVVRHVHRKSALCVLMMDIDHFKQYNDRFGHMAGDLVLKTLAELLSDHFKDPGNLICRYGGEEFTVLLTDCSKPQAVKLAETFREVVKKKEIFLRRQSTQITISIGVASYPSDGQSKEELLQTADGALYQAKNQGRDRVCFS